MLTNNVITFCCVQWVDDMADAGADQYTFHLEATGKSQSDKMLPYGTLRA